MTPDTPEPCPFCGEAPISFPSGDGSGLMIECVTPDCVRPHVSYIPPAEAIAKWNTRSPEGETERGDLERIARALSDFDCPPSVRPETWWRRRGGEYALQAGAVHAALKPHTP